MDTLYIPNSTSDHMRINLLKKSSQRLNRQKSIIEVDEINLPKDHDVDNDTDDNISLPNLSEIPKYQSK